VVWTCFKKGWWYFGGWGRQTEVGLRKHGERLWLRYDWLALTSKWCCGSVVRGEKWLKGIGATIVVVVVFVVLARPGYLGLMAAKWVCCCCCCCCCCKYFHYRLLLLMSYVSNDVILKHVVFQSAFKVCY